MDAEELINQANSICDKAKTCGAALVVGTLAEATEFLRAYAGERNAFYRQLDQIDPLKLSSDFIREIVTGNMEAFARYVRNGLLEGMSIERKAQIDVVSDFLEQAQVLLESKDVHPAAPTVIIGAAL